MKSFICICLCGLLALTYFSSAAPVVPATTDALKAKGLEKTGKVYALASVEQDFLQSMADLRKIKYKADEEKRTRRMYEAKINSSKAVMTQNRKEYDTLKDREVMATTIIVRNRIITRMNLLIVKGKEAQAINTEYEEKLAKLSHEGENLYVDRILALEPKADVVNKAYEAAAADPDIKSLLARVNGKLGPTPELVAALDELKKDLAELNSEAIPLHEDHGVQTLAVLLNGETYQMGLDSGSTSIMIPGDIAEKLKVVPGPQDPIINIKMADGSMIQGQEVTLKTVRVGRFTVENVPCVVLMNRTAQQATPLLGNSFLAHFVMKLDQAGGTLHLTEIVKSDAPEKPAKIHLPASAPSQPDAGVPEK